jgi:signal transduction histidine kinase
MEDDLMVKLKPPNARYRFSFLIFSGVAVLLFLLAGLQYRWISEVSRAEQDRLKENLRLAMNRFARDFESEFFRPAFMIAKPLDGPPSHQPDQNFEAMAAARVARQYDEWTSSSRFPGLLQDLFVTRVPAPGRVDLFRFDSQSRSLVHSEWPKDLLKFRDFCIAESTASTRMFVEVPDLEDVPAVIFPFGPAEPPPPTVHIAASPPMPIFNVKPGLNLQVATSTRPAIFGPTGWEIIRINRTSFERFLSHLVEQNFPRKGDFDYDILIVRKPSNQVIYSSSPNLDAAGFQSTADAGMPLDIPGGVSLFGKASFLKGGLASVAFGIGGEGPTSLPPPDPAMFQRPARGWQLYAKHHSGSLQSFASQFRARNLAVSSAAFVLLGLGVAFAFLSAQRIRAMGKLQLEFAAGLSHELRTPLTVIRSAGYNLVHGSIASKEDVVRYGTIIQQEGTRLSEIVEQALLFAQTQSGRCQYERNPVQVGSVIEDAVASCRGLLLKYPCEIVSSVPPDLPPASTDEKALGHCIRNLLVNALKYSKREGRIQISVQPPVQAHVPEVEISIANEGPGIDRDEMPHIFEPFFRGKNATGTPGNGLGLYMVKSILTALGGRITADSSGNETRFALYVPASDTSNGFLKAS